MSLKSTKWIGKQRLHFEEIDSTNKKAKELIGKGIENGTLITADTQTAGSGRRGRKWSSEQGAGIYMSVIFRHNLQPNQAPMLTLVAALAVVKALNDGFKNKKAEEILQFQSVSADLSRVCVKAMQHEDAVCLCHLREDLSGKDKGGMKTDLFISSPIEMQEASLFKIKWPNDIIINGKKVCGILTEMILQQNRIDAVILGIGINVSNNCFSEEIAATASSLYLETDLEWDKEQLIEDVWKWFEVYYTLFLETGDLCRLKAEYEAFLVNKNEKVKVLDPQGEYTGMAKGITNTGELLVDTGAEIKAVVGGEVSVRGIYGYV